MRLNAVFVLTILPLFTGIVAQHDTTLWSSHWRGVRVPTGWIRALQAELAKGGRLWSFWWNVVRSLLSRCGSRGGLNWLRGDDWGGGNWWRLWLRVGLLIALGLLSAIVWPSSTPGLLLLPLLVRWNEAVVHPIRHTHLLEPGLARNETTTGRDHPHSSSHLCHQRHLVHHHLLEYQWVRHLSCHSCIQVNSRDHSILEYRRHGDLRLLLLLGESGATRSDPFKETSTCVAATLTVATIAKHSTWTRREIGTTRLIRPMGGRGSGSFGTGR